MTPSGGDHDDGRRREEGEPPAPDWHDIEEPGWLAEDLVLVAFDRDVVADEGDQFEESVNEIGTLGDDTMEDERLRSEGDLSQPNEELGTRAVAPTSDRHVTDDSKQPVESNAIIERVRKYRGKDVAGMDDSALWEQTMKDGIVPGKEKKSETRVHTERARLKRRPSGLKYNKDKDRKGKDGPCDDDTIKKAAKRKRDEEDKDGSGGIAA